MALVKAKCPDCNGVIEVDKDKKAGICKYCGNAFIVEEAINNYITNIQTEVTNVSANEVHIHQTVAAEDKATKYYKNLLNIINRGKISDYVSGDCGLFSNVYEKFVEESPVDERLCEIRIRAYIVDDKWGDRYCSDNYCGAQFDHFKPMEDLEILKSTNEELYKTCYQLLLDYINEKCTAHAKFIANEVGFNFSSKEKFKGDMLELKFKLLGTERLWDFYDMDIDYYKNIADYKRYGNVPGGVTLSYPTHRMSKWEWGEVAEFTKAVQNVTEIDEGYVKFLLKSVREMSGTPIVKEKPFAELIRLIKGLAPKKVVDEEAEEAKKLERARKKAELDEKKRILKINIEKFWQKYYRLLREKNTESALRELNNTTFATYEQKGEQRAMFKKKLFGGYKYICKGYEKVKVLTESITKGLEEANVKKAYEYLSKNIK